MQCVRHSPLHTSLPLSHQETGSPSALLLTSCKNHLETGYQALAGQRFLSSPSLTWYFCMLLQAQGSLIFESP